MWKLRSNARPKGRLLHFCQGAERLQSCPPQPHIAAPQPGRAVLCKFLALCKPRNLQAPHLVSMLILAGPPSRVPMRKRVTVAQANGSLGFTQDPQEQ